MLGWLFASPAERRLLPGGRFRGPTPFVIAIMTFAMMTVAAAGLALSNAAGLVVQGIENRCCNRMIALHGNRWNLIQAMNAASTKTLSMPARDCDMTKARLMKAMPAKKVSLPITPRSNT